MNEDNKQISNSPRLTKPSRLSFSGNLPSLTSILSYAFIIFLIYAFFSKITLSFYSSVVFSFYSLTNKMWISVICLGVFQTFLLIPFRIIKLYKANHIKEFVENIEDVNDVDNQQFLFKQHVKKGTRTILFYSIDFWVQLISYTSIGRLFLTDFYNTPLDPKMLYSFVSYPQYPIQDRFFKIPYPYFSSTIDFGMKWVYIAWIVIFGILLAFRVIKYVSSNYFKKNRSSQMDSLKSAYKTISGQFILLCLLAWIIIRHFPINWHLGIFSGDVAVQNTRFNTITAIVTFASLLWFGIHNIYNKSKIAKAAQIPQNIIDKTEAEMFKNSLFNSTLIGLGAFYITNQIPSAFELSIFTLEIISLISPLTLDKLILNSKIKPVEKNSDKELETVENEKS